MSATSVSVIVPTLRRITSLRRCVAALATQRSQPREAIIVCRVEDTASRATADEHSRLPDATAVTAVTVDVPGVIAAMNAGLAVATGDIIALTDDDAAPWPDWVERITAHFEADPKLGAVGGKDWQYKPVRPGGAAVLDDGHETRAGHMQWWGRVIGMHHWATPGPPREVAVIKGVNCAFRAAALRAVGGFDTRLAGSGAQVHWELSVCLALKRAGWKIVFDPAMGVDHFPADRFDEDQRCQFNALAQRNMVYNETLALAEHFGRTRRAVFMAWALGIGTHVAPGLLQVPRLLLRREQAVGRRLWATLKGRCAGYRKGAAAHGAAPGVTRKS